MSAGRLFTAATLASSSVSSSYTTSVLIHNIYHVINFSGLLGIIIVLRFRLKSCIGCLSIYLTSPLIINGVVIFSHVPLNCKRTYSANGISLSFCSKQIFYYETYKTAFNLKLKFTKLALLCSSIQILVKLSFFTFL